LEAENDKNTWKLYPVGKEGKLPPIILKRASGY